MGSEIYPKVHENPRAFFSSSSLILLEPLAHGSSDWSLPREDCIREPIHRESIPTSSPKGMRYDYEHTSS